MGRPRKPTALKVLEGAQPCRINRAEPTPARGIGPPPEFLDDVARSAWDRLAAQLDDAGLLTAVDRDALAAYCSTYALWRKAVDAVADEGLTTVGQFGEKANPNVQTLLSLQKQLASLMAAFGLTPSSRSSLKVSARVEDDPILAFLARPNPDAESPKARPKAKA